MSGHSMAKISATLMLALSLAGAGVGVCAQDRSAEIQQFAGALQSGNLGARIIALKEITNSGLTDRGLFDSINTRLLDGYRIDAGNGKGVDEVSWMCKALASSGIPEYKDTLAKVAADAPSPKVRNYAQQSLGTVERYAERNALLAKQTAETEGLSPEAARLINSLRATDLRLKKDAAKVLSRSNLKEPRLYEVASEELLAGVKQAGANADHADTLAWLCKALAASGNVKYRPVLQRVYDETRDEKLRKYAKQSLDVLQ